MSTADIKKTAETKMGRSIESFKGELQKIRTGRAHPGMLDQIHVDYYGSPVPLSQVAQLSLLDARTIGVQPWEKPMISKVEKAIRESDLGLNPSTTGEIIRVPMPARGAAAPQMQGITNQMSQVMTIKLESVK